MSRADAREEGDVVRDLGLDTLLDHQGQTLFVDEAGHGVTFIAVRTEVTPQRPQGLRCSLVLHAPDGERLVGFDNARPVRERRGPGTRRRRESDHRHWRQSIGPYEYWCAAVLLEDFWNEVAAVLKERGSAP
ncbi:MAG: hypothetical protein OXG71_06465 [Rhodospirillales bacterium]|nr:hypothetical protein [Rhodospirillales bacterium]